MAFDGLLTRAMVSELQQLTNGRISKIHQPNAQEIVMIVRADGKNAKLLVSIHPSYARVHLTEQTMVNPAEPPLFCMVLRKHVEGGKIERIEQIGVDRIIRLTIESKNEIGDTIQRYVYVEIMGRHSNLLLVDPDKQIIVDSMKHVPPSVNRYRTILPGQPFILPPAQQKEDPFQLSKEQFQTVLTESTEPSDLVNYLAGFSPVHAQELWYRCQQDQVNAFPIYQQFLQDFQHVNEPCLVEKKGKPFFSATTLTYLEQPITYYDHLGALLDKVYFARAERERVKAQAADLERWLDNEIAKITLKQKKLQKEQAQARNLDQYQLFGELLTANSYAIEKGTTEVYVDNYYEEGQKVRIPLDPQKSAIDNAQRYYTRYTKAKNALMRIAEQLNKAQEDLTYFEMIKQQVIQAAPEDIEEIREELIQQGWMKARKGKKKSKPKKPQPELYTATDGTKISVGKNNIQNDYLTFKGAARDHLWLHTKDIPGSHVVIHDATPDEATIQEAAILAAYFSKARESSSVPVDYTMIRHVKKPAGAKPGFVIYFEQKTIYVTPDEDIVMKLKK